MAKGRIAALVVSADYKDDHNRCFQVLAAPKGGRVDIRWGDGSRETVDEKQCIDSVVFRLDDGTLTFKD